MKAKQIMFEVVPPQTNASEESISKKVDKIAAIVKELNCIDYINIPQILEENYEGKPFYKNLEPREFGVLLREKTETKIVVNRGVVYFKSRERFNEWLEETFSKYKILDLVFVGGSNNNITYPGPKVIEANREALANGFSNIGNICIPQRKNEAEKLIFKTESGCSFFTTQIIFESENIKQLLKQYSNECKKNNLKPGVFFLSFAPASDKRDLVFFDWLGTKIPEDIRTELKQSKHIDKDSIQLAIRLFSDILDFSKENNLDVPLSVNIESVSYKNLDLAKEMIESFESLIFY